MPHTDYSKVYTHAPEQHPNLLLGSLQLLFWIVFRPSVWRNHLKRIDPALDPESQSWNRVKRRNFDLWVLLLQGYLILPLLLNLSLNLLLLILGKSTEKFIFNVFFGTLISLVVGVYFGVSVNLACGLFISIIESIAFGIAFEVSVRLFAITIGIFVFWLGFGLYKNNNREPINVVFGKILQRIGKIANIITLIWKLMRFVAFVPLIKLFNKLLYRFDSVKSKSITNLLRYHSAFWDEWQHRPLKGLEKHLILVMERNPDEGKAAIKYLSTSPQRWAAQTALIEMDTRRIESCADLEAVRQVHRDLATSELELETLVSSLIRSFNRFSEDVNAALNQATTYNQRLSLKAVADRLDAVSRELTISNDEYAIRLQPISIRWSQIITNCVEELAKASELRQEIDSPYITGIPLSEQQEIFVGRTDISVRIEQLLIDRRRPPLLLYGQRRMGKTSLLNNLGRLLPNTIIPMFVDLQGSASRTTDYSGFLYNLARGMMNSASRQRGLTLPSLTREMLALDPFTRFDEWLDEVEQALEDNTVLLALDEFEVLDNAIAKGRFDEQDVLGMLRNLIQHRPRFKVLLAGSHTLEEYQRWASYLINVQVLRISYLQEEEARQLIEQPVKNFPLHYEPDAVERVLELTRCHPCLVQLLCNEIVDIKNQQRPGSRRLATSKEVEAAVPQALTNGSFFFADIQNNQIKESELKVLRFLAEKGEGITVSKKALSRDFPDSFDSSINLLLRRELIEEAEDGYRFQVELIRQWFAQK
ncbi:ATP-binding protein [Hassallia byssoidea VB512170]|uniref:ATP-binding protein n=2 Tax=Hassallia TaxID=482629 RepID=A0A846HEK1_9CYAN|nr:AAA family ATPase [Hassalia byssoidea]NEU75229.1 ATP-binding protein [Hassalia byssoidea VB512170]